ncbi:MAG: hypothetical protein J6T05_00825 [Prevotella sp.]|nr:hypothetical protein [Prevotella sp.]
MTDEQIAAKKEHAGEKKASMKRRDDHHDYTERRMYMITLEVEGRRPVFGRLVGNAFAPKGSKDEPRIELTALGKAVQSEWMGIHDYYPQIEVMAVQMMPDHMHGILFVREQLPVHLGQVISGFKAGCRKAEKALIAAAEPQPTENGAGAIEKDARPTEKRAVSSQQATALLLQGSQVPLQGVSQAYRPLFAKGYNDLILRSYDELPAWQNYLHDNPRRLLMKRARPEWLRPFFGLQIGQHCFSGIGNRALLTAAKRKAVRVSRRLTEQEIAREVERYLEEARQGTVLVSPAISPGEKRVMRAAFDAGLPTIVIMENGFTPLSKPHGEQFYACGQGTLLMLSPWEHHNEKRKLTAAQCTQMNLMALEICE